ncbi:alpha/beta hydrolase [Streptomyces sp. NPDC086147]|uniref:alpha/beta fold hydrolase n=1 Tax=Streptomyces sp. NPDC086147 TaxID=3155295 RepID=UPI00344ECF22
MPQGQVQECRGAAQSARGHRRREGRPRQRPYGGRAVHRKTLSRLIIAAPVAELRWKLPSSGRRPSPGGRRAPPDHGPMLVLVGVEDVSTPPADAEAIAARIGGARLTPVDAAGHTPTLEQPGAVNAALREFLAEAEERPPPS